MSDIFTRPGVVDARDKYGRPIEVPLPAPMAVQPSCKGDCAQSDRPCRHPERCVSDEVAPLFTGLKNAVLWVLAGAGAWHLLSLLWGVMTR